MKASSVILSVLLTEIHYTDRVAKMLAIYREMKKKMHMHPYNLRRGAYLYPGCSSYSVIIEKV